jgi:hypothetical protein
MDFTGSERLMVGDGSKMAQRRFSPMDGAEMVQRWFRVGSEIMQRYFRNSSEIVYIGFLWWSRL